MSKKFTFNRVRSRFYSLHLYDPPLNLFTISHLTTLATNPFQSAAST